MVTRDGYAHGEFCWVDLAAHDKSAAAEFYSALFDWRTIDQDTDGGPPYAQFMLGNQAVAGLGEMNDEMKGMGIPPMWNSYVNVTDIEAVVAHARKLGATITVPVIDILDAGRLAFFLDPAGTSIALWEKNQHAGADLTSEPGSCCWNELATRDMDDSMQFYGELFGWTFRVHEGSPSPYRIIENQGRDNGGFLQMTPEWGEHPPFWAVYFAVKNAAKSAESAAAAGGRCLHGPFETPVGPIAVLQDPQGAIFSVLQPSASC